MQSILFIFAHMSLNVFSNLSFKRSALSKGIGKFSVWQIVGNTASFIGVIAYTALLKYLPVSAAFPITQGLAVIGVTFIAAWLILHEKITPMHLFGTGLIVAGIVCVAL